MNAIMLLMHSNLDSSVHPLPARAEAAKAAGNRAFFERDWPAAVGAYSQVTSTGCSQNGARPVLHMALNMDGVCSLLTTDLQ